MASRRTDFHSGPRAFLGPSAITQRRVPSRDAWAYRDQTSSDSQQGIGFVLRANDHGHVEVRVVGGFSTCPRAIQRHELRRRLDLASRLPKRIDRPLARALDLPEGLRDRVLLDHCHEVGAPGRLTLDQPESFQVGDDGGRLIAADVGQTGNLTDGARPVQAHRAHR